MRSEEENLNEMTMELKGTVLIRLHQELEGMGTCIHLHLIIGDMLSYIYVLDVWIHFYIYGL